MKPLFFFITVLSFSPFSLASQDWKPAGDRIRTKWTEQLSPDNVHKEYPRPQLIRAGGDEVWRSLNGLWDYSVTGKDSDMDKADGKILVPFALESSLSGVGRTLGRNEALWYSRDFVLPSSWRKKRVILHFEAVDWSAEVFINGKYIGAHTGGFTHFSFDISPYIKKGNSSQNVRVKVIDATDNDFQPRGKQVMGPDGIWYTPVSGIWQTVWIEAVGIGHISDYKIVSDIDNAKLLITPECVSSLTGDSVEISLCEGGTGYSPERGVFGKVISKCEAGSGESLTLEVPEMKLWSPDYPYIYGLIFKLIRGGKVIDEVYGYTAMRKISEISDAYGRKRLALNNKPLFHFGPLDQGWWPDGLYTPPSDEALIFDIIKTKNFGYNMIRKHIKVEPSRWYFYCDMLGMLVWQDMPSFADNRKNKWGTHFYNEGTDFPASVEAKANYYKEWGEIMAQLDKFQSVVVWVPFNEAWGQFDTKDVVDFTKRQDPYRLINMASGGNWVDIKVDGKKISCGDILDTHHYPEPRVHFWDFDMINVLGEYGGIGLPVEGHLWQKEKNWGYVKYQNAEEVLKEYEAFAEKLINLIRCGCSAAVYTQTTDVEGEVNGLMTYDRKVVKVDENKLRAINSKVIEAIK